MTRTDRLVRAVLILAAVALVVDVAQAAIRGIA